MKNDWEKELEQFDKVQLSEGRMEEMLDEIKENPTKQRSFEGILRKGCLQQTRVAVQKAHDADRKHFLEISTGAHSSPPITKSSMERGLFSIFRSKTFQFTAAACLVILIWQLFPTGEAVTLARVLQRLDEVKAGTFTTRIVTYDEGTEKTVSHHKMYISATQGQRKDTFDKNNKPFTTEYTSLGQARWVVAFHADKSYTETLFSEQDRKEMPWRISPKGWVIQLLGLTKREDIQNLGTSSIEGRPVKGFESTYIHWANKNLKMVLRLWIDIDTLLPAKMISESHRISNGEHYLSEIHEDFQWNVHLDPSVFAPHIPEGYRKRSE